MATYEVILKKTVVYYQLITVEDANSSQDAIIAAEDLQDDYWEFAYDEYDVEECEQID